MRREDADGIRILRTGDMDSWTANHRAKNLGFATLVILSFGFQGFVYRVIDKIACLWVNLEWEVLRVVCLVFEVRGACCGMCAGWICIGRDVHRL